MSEPAAPIVTLWSDHLDHWPDRAEVESLQRLGFSFPTIEDQNEWIVGFLILDDRIESMAVVYVTRCTTDAGIDFELRAAEPAPARADDVRSAIARFVATSHRVESLNEEISRLWQLTDEQLLQEFGAQLVHGKRHDKDIDHERTRRAQNWLAINRAELQALICANPDTQEITASPDGVGILAALLADLLTESAALGVATFLLRHGLDQLCGPIEGSGPDD